MGTYHDEIHGFNIVEKIDEAKSTISALENDFKLDIDDLDYYDRFYVVLEQIKIIIEFSDPYMIRVTQLQDLVDSLEKIIEKSKEIDGDTFYDTMDILNNEFDIILEILSGFIFTRSDEQIKGFRNSTVNLRRMVKRYVSELEEKYSNSIEMIQETASTISSEMENYDLKLKGIDISYEEKQDELLQDYQEKIEEINDQLENDFEDFKESIENKMSELESSLEGKEADYEENLESSFKRIMDEKDAKFRELNDSWIEKFTNIYNKFEEEKAAYLFQWKEHITDIERIAGALAEHSMAYSFKNIADIEKKSKKNWNILTILGFLALMIYGVTLFVISFNSPFTWANLTGRLSLGLGIGAFIAYAGRQVSIHGRVERYCRETEIELASLGPYFAEFKDKPDELLGVRLALAEKFFGKGDIVSDPNLKEKDKGDKPINSYLSPEHIKALIELVEKLK
ncbi:hypothetical protein [Paenibacillus woosongensis]|uniref:Uncharacterized protein n=1 Tax=Paenibacillus woosongensis TaxID=307580 RepID=A0ABQ4MTJ5_9BACL|nr:hypothetical protein [Paenibacillus woosongensis]GIP59244.1 hypothetical protein J15TS10_30580 [Paenibacillus woosongensis]